MAAWRAGWLRGCTTENLPHVDVATLDALWDQHATVARIGMHFHAYGSRYMPAASDLDLLQTLLDAAAARGRGIVLLGLFDDGAQPQPLWHDARRQSAWVAGWRAFAATAAGRHPALAGVDLLNEPHLPGQPLADAQRSWHELASRALLALRRARCRAPVVCEPVLGAHPSALRDMPLLADPAVVYSPHFYTPHDITHQGVNAHWTQTVPYPAGAEWGLGGWDPALGPGRIDAQRLAAELQAARDFQARHRVPVYVGEFGCVRWAPDGSAVRWVSDCIDLFAASGWNWSYHAFRAWHGWDAEIDSEQPAPGPRDAEAPMVRRLRAGFAAPLRRQN